MKILYVAILACACGVCAATAQTTSADRLLEATGGQRGKPASRGLAITAKPNTIVKGNVAYEGIAVQVVKTSNPLQLVNPAAPAKYGSAEDNVLRDPLTGHAAGLKFFAIRF